MVRTFVEVEKGKVAFDVPLEYEGKTVEVILFAAEETVAHQQRRALLASDDAFTAVRINTNDWKFDRDEANER